MSVAGIALATTARKLPKTPRAPATPFTTGPLTAVGPDGLPVGIATDAPALLLYVSETCPHCSAELAAWEGAAARLGQGPLPVAVLSPESTTRDVAYLPPGFRDQWMWDASGEVGRALGVQGVPFLAWMEPGGTVRDVWLGRTDPSRRIEWIRHLDGLRPEAAR